MLTKFIERLTCNHRHTIDEHPACFQNGNINLKKADELYRQTGKYWYNLDGLRVGYLDIEADGLKSDFSTMLSWCIKEKDGEIASDVITKEDIFSGEVDKRLIDSCVAELSKYAIIITYYGTKYDLPFVRSKALHYNSYFPGFTVVEQETKSGTSFRLVPELYHFDLYYTVKSKLNLSRNSLDNACDFLGIEGKTPIKKDVWRKAKYGDPESLQEVLMHNKADVVILEQLHNRLEPYSKWTRKGT